MPDQTRDDTYEECSHSWSEMPRIAAVAVDAAGLAEPAPTRWAYDQAVKALEKHRARADEAERKLHQVAMTKVWTNEDGKKFVFVDDLATALGLPVAEPPAPAELGGCSCSEFGPCPACAPDAAALAGALADDAAKAGGPNG